MSEYIIDGRVAVELNCIFNYLDLSIFYQIPKDLIELIRNSQDKNYKFVYDKTKSLNDQKLLSETRKLFSTIFIKYCCNSELQKELIEKCKENEKAWKEKYSYENLFPNDSKSKATEIKEEKNDLVKVEEEKKSIIVRIFDKIKKILSMKI